MRQEHVRVDKPKRDDDAPKRTIRFVATIDVPEKSVHAHGGPDRMAVALTSAIRAMGLRVLVTPPEK